MESREPHSIRFTPAEWEALCAAAVIRALEPAVFVRVLTMYALEDVTRSARVEASVGIPSRMLTGSPRRSRF
jgi:hypothetical protein